MRARGQVHAREIAWIVEIQARDLLDAPQAVGQRVAVHVQDGAGGAAVEAARDEGVQGPQQLAMVGAPLDLPELLREAESVDPAPSESA